MNKVILLDRDGVINQDSLCYIKSAEEFVLIPGSIKAIARLTSSGYKIGIATNQSGISRGLYTHSELQNIHNKMIHCINKEGGEIAAIEFCPHHPEEKCSCRKPQPGMLINLAKKLNCSLEEVSFVGDRVSDIQAALAVGAKPQIVLSPMTDREALLAYPQVPVFSSLSHYVDSLGI
jgi:D-glycero-D-manno-heptose 1,7-bisphosphate phosphatase